MDFTCREWSVFDHCVAFFTAVSDCPGSHNILCNKWLGRYFVYDDGIYVGLRLIEILSKTNKKLSELVNVIPKYISTPEIRIECQSDKEKFDITHKVVDYFLNKYNCNTIDGVRINFDFGWGLIRSSNTQPVIVCRFEAETLERMEEIQSKILDKLTEFGEIKLEHCWDNSSIPGWHK